jgi:hypothetical protein
MDQNPYAPPKAPVADRVMGDGKPVASVVPLYTPNQVAVATFLASALAGAWLVAANFRAVGQPIRARHSLWIGIGVTIATVLFGLVLPERFPNIVLPLGVAAGVRALVERHFAAMLAEHAATGGELRSWWRVVGISALIIAVLGAVAFLGVFGYYIIRGDTGD